MRDEQHNEIIERLNRARPGVPAEQASPGEWIVRVHRELGSLSDTILNARHEVYWQKYAKAIEKLGGVCMEALRWTMKPNNSWPRTIKLKNCGVGYHKADGVVADERQKQIDRKDYDPEHDDSHTPLAWVAILMHEWSEMPLYMMLSSAWSANLNNQGLDDYLRVMRKMAAVCVAALEALDHQYVIEVRGGEAKENTCMVDEEVNDECEH